MTRGGRSPRARWCAADVRETARGTQVFAHVEARHRDAVPRTAHWPISQALLSVADPSSRPIGRDVDVASVEMIGPHEVGLVAFQHPAPPFP
jgi:hypothetical protein